MTIKPLRRLRKARGLTLAGLAELVGCSPALIRRLETGERRLGAWAGPLAQALGVAEAELVPPLTMPDGHPHARVVPIVSRSRLPLVPHRGVGVPRGTVVILHPSTELAAFRLDELLSDELLPGTAVVVDYADREPAYSDIYVVIARGRVEIRARLCQGWRRLDRRRPAMTERDGVDDVAVVARVVCAVYDVSALPLPSPTPHMVDPEPAPAP